ncbi:hypothetical protein BDK51DRAFT_49391, partial [Blyttiomyces helicus]
PSHATTKSAIPNGIRSVRSKLASRRRASDPKPNRRQHNQPQLHAATLHRVPQHDLDGAHNLLNRLVPFDKNITFHIFIGRWIVCWTYVHVVAHYFNCLNVESVLSSHLATIELVFVSAPELTGQVISATFFLMLTSAVEPIRRKYFEIFWFTHYLYAKRLGCHYGGKEEAGMAHLTRPFTCANSSSAAEARAAATDSALFADTAEDPLGVHPQNHRREAHSEFRWGEQIELLSAELEEAKGSTESAKAAESAASVRASAAEEALAEAGRDLATSQADIESLLQSARMHASDRESLTATLDANMIHATAIERLLQATCDGLRAEIVIGAIAYTALEIDNCADSQRAFAAEARQAATVEDCVLHQGSMRGRLEAWDVGKVKVAELNIVIQQGEDKIAGVEAVLGAKATELKGALEAQMAAQQELAPRRARRKGPNCYGDSSIKEDRDAVAKRVCGHAALKKIGGEEVNDLQTQLDKKSAALTVARSQALLSDEIARGGSSHRSELEGTSSKKGDVYRKALADLRALSSERDEAVEQHAVLAGHARVLERRIGGAAALAGQDIARLTGRLCDSETAMERVWAENDEALIKSWVLEKDLDASQDESLQLRAELGPLRLHVGRLEIDAETASKRADVVESLIVVARRLPSSSSPSSWSAAPEPVSRGCKRPRKEEEDEEHVRKEQRMEQAQGFGAGSSSSG